MTSRLASARPDQRGHARLSDRAKRAAERGPGNGRNRLLSEEAMGILRRRARELGGLGFLVAALALATALATYTVTDPSWNTAAPADGAATVGNWLGRPGALVADVLVQTLGVAGYLLAGIVAGWGLRLVRHDPPRRWSWRILLCLVSVLLTAVVLAGFDRGTGTGGSAGLLLLSQLVRLGPGTGATGGLLAGLLLLPVALAGVLGALGVGPGRLLAGLRGLTSLRLPVPAGGRLSAAAGGLLDRVMPLATGLRDRVRDSVGGLSLRRAPVARPTAAPATRRGMPRLDPLPDRAAPAAAPPPEAGTDQDGDAPPLPESAPLLVPPAVQPLPRPLARRPARRTDPVPEPVAGGPAPEEGDAAPGREGRRSRLATIVLPKLKPVETSRRTAADRARQPLLDLEPVEPGTYELPPLDLLQQPAGSGNAAYDEAALQQNASLLEGVLEDFGVRGEIVKVSPGPVVTLYELEPAPGTKSSRVIGLADDIARSMSAVSVRVAVVPGRNVIGIELPNRKREMVYLRELLEADAYGKTQGKLALVLGKDIGGGPVIADLARMPHLLVAGTTGSGKSVAINTMILSLLYKHPPEKCRFIMVDPKMLELSIYEGIPHLLAPVVTDPSKAVVALKWAVREMEDRYRSMSKLGVRNIDGYNARLKEAREKGEVLTRRVQTGFDPDTGKPIEEELPIDLTELPYIVVIVDEMADLMLVAGKEIEAAIQRLAQMARAAGIHLIMATQRPSVDVITGTIKANFPTRISFQVTSKIDSRTILGEQGAEQLLGQGDMLYMAGGGRITRVHGPFVRDDEVEEIVKHLKAQGEPLYVDAVTEEEEEFDPASLEGGGKGGGGGEGGEDALYDQAVAIVCRERKASTSFIQRHLRIGYNSAARLIERMEKEGVVSRANHVGKREVLARDVDDTGRVN